MTAVHAPSSNFRFWVGPVKEVAVGSQSDAPNEHSAEAAIPASSAASSPPIVSPTLSSDLIAALLKAQEIGAGGGSGVDPGDTSSPSEFTRELFKATTGDTLSTETQDGITAIAIRDPTGNLVNPMESNGFSAPALLASDLTLAQAYAGNGPTFDARTIASLFTQIQDQGESLPSGWLGSAQAWLQQHGPQAS